MSDYISKSKLKEISEIQKADFNSVEGIRTWIDSQPTVDEKEIIRKPFERVVERLEGKKWGTSEWRDKWRDEIIGECIEIVKEVGGIE